MGTNSQKPQDDFDALAKQLEQDVESAVNSVASVAQNIAVSVAESVRQGIATAQPAWQQAMQEMKQGNENVKRKAKENAKKAKRHPEALTKKANGAAGEAGGLGLAAGVMVAVTLIALFEADPDAQKGALLLGVIAVWLAFASLKAWVKSNRLRNLAVYMNLLGARTYITVQSLAAGTGKSERATRKDLQKMMTSGLLEGARISPDGTRLFAGEMAFQLYMAQQDEAARTAPQEAPATPQPTEKVDEKPQGVLAECDAFAATLRRHAVLIENDVAAQQLTQMEAHTRRIRAWLAAHPGQENRVRRFTSYYLPTVIKLLVTYAELSPHAVEGSVAARSQQDITNILATINTAFQTLEDGLVQDTAMDVSAEISALQTVMAQEGLTQDEISRESMQD